MQTASSKRKHWKTFWPSSPGKISKMMDEARYTNSLSIVMKFRKGLDQDIQDQIAEMAQGRPSDDDPEGWYSTACNFDANQAANKAFHGVLFQVTDFN